MANMVMMVVMRRRRRTRSIHSGHREDGPVKWFAVLQSPACVKLESFKTPSGACVRLLICFAYANAHILVNICV